MIRVKDCMTTDVITIPSDLNLADARQRMFNHKIRHLPVFAGEHLVGIVSERDINTVENIPGLRSEAISVQHVMSSNPFTCSPDDGLDHVAKTMAENKLGAAIVMDQGKLVGIVSIIDVLHKLVEILCLQESSRKV